MSDIPLHAQENGPLPENGKAAPAPGQVEVVFDPLLGTLRIPSNIDPELFDAWYNKEIRELSPDPVPDRGLSTSGRPLPLLFAAYVGTLALLVAIVTGLLRDLVPDDILDGAIKSLFLFGGIGYLAGLIMERLLRESTEHIVREVVRRSDEADGRTVS